MYKHKKTPYLEKSKRFFHSIKRSLILIITTLMLGMSNAMYNEDKTIYGKRKHTEQKHKKD